MSKFIGRQVNIGLGKETVRGTPVSASYWIPKTDLTYERRTNQVVDESSVSVIEDSIDQAVTEKFAEGTLDAIVREKSMGLILLNTFGQVDTTTDDPEAGVNTHSFTFWQAANAQSLTLELEEPNVNLRFPLVMINSLNIEAVVQDYIKFSADFRSKTWADNTTSGADYSTVEYPFKADHATFKVADDLAGLGAASAIPVRRFSITIDKNVEDDHNLGSLEPTDILNKQVSIEGEIEMLYDNENFKTYMEDDLAKALRLDIVNSDVTIGAVSNPRLTIDLAKVKFTTTETPFGNDDLIVLTASFKGFYSLSDSISAEMRLVNTVTY